VVKVDSQLAMLKALDFFAGSGLVALGLAPEFETVWANDIDPKKRDVYIANHPSDQFNLCDIRNVSNSETRQQRVSMS
jgi:site-specific DNA-cytosine methylase